MLPIASEWNTLLIIIIYHSLLFKVQFHLVFNSSAPKQNGKWGFYSTSHLKSVTRHICSHSHQTLYSTVYPDSLYFSVS